MDCGIKHFIKTLVKGEDVWLRPIPKNEKEMYNLTYFSLSKYNYAELMLHSSELMPGGSPYFRTSDSIEHLYSVLRKYFKTMKDYGVEGITLSDYAEKFGVENV